MSHDKAIREIRRLPISGMNDEDIVITYMIMRMGTPTELQDDFVAGLKNPAMKIDVMIAPVERCPECGLEDHAGNCRRRPAAE